MATKLILDTDIGTDVDDAWALALCLASPEIELLGVTLVHADVDTRAKIALKMLKLAGRSDVPVYKGLSYPLTEGLGVYWHGHEGTDTDFSDIADLCAKDGAVDFILDTIRRNPQEVVVAPIGPMTNIGAAIRKDCCTMHKVKRLAVMGATYAGEGRDKAGPEHNVRCDPYAAKLVMESGIPATVVGLNVTGKVCIRREDLAAIKDSPLGGYLAAMTGQYFDICGRDYTFMHDPLAISTEIDRSVVTTRKMTAEVLDEGKVAFTTDPDGSLDVAVDVDVHKFQNLLRARVRSLCLKGI